MKIALITGSAGLIGSEAVRFFANKGLLVVGIDNNMRKEFFGNDASTEGMKERLIDAIPDYIHYDKDIRDRRSMEYIFAEYGKDIDVIIHTAAQPSHDWAIKDPLLDFSVNAEGTLLLLEMTRKHCPNATFIFTSTNKVYGDTPNSLPLIELETRWEVDCTHSYYQYGVDESMSIDHSKHSLFGASKVSADIFVQEYGRYFDMKTACFRGGCLTGPHHAGIEFHGFLSYLIKCAIHGTRYNVFGYNGKQVRDNIHSYDLVNMFWHFYQDPKIGAVYNAGGSRYSHCSLQEAIALAEKVVGKKMNVVYCENNRVADHIWWISDIRKFKSDYPRWNYKYSLEDIFAEISQELTVT